MPPSLSATAFASVVPSPKYQEGTRRLEFPSGVVNRGPCGGSCCRTTLFGTLSGADATWTSNTQPVRFGAAAGVLWPAADAAYASARKRLRSEPPALREPVTALRFAKASVQKSGGTDSGNLDILAQAYFANHDIARAIEAEERALALLAPAASHQPNQPIRRRLEAELAKFKAAR
jgi:hypothetical protein